MEQTINLIKQLVNDTTNESFDDLTCLYFDGLCTKELTDIERFQVIVAILLAVTKTSLQNQEYENLEIIKNTYNKLYEKLVKKTKRNTQKLELHFSNDFYQTTLFKLLNNKS